MNTDRINPDSASMIDIDADASPKRRRDTHSSNDASAYNYYAAFSHSFVSKLIGELGVKNNELLMDPWNGRGTTTTIAAEMGLRAIGFDLNPAMVAIAEARLVDRAWAKNALDAVERIKTIDSTSNCENSNADGLSRWLTPSAVAVFRQLQIIFCGIARNIGATKVGTRETMISQQRLEYFLNLCLCSTLRKVLVPLRTSNPTWIPQKLPHQKRMRPSGTTLLRTTKAFLREAVAALTSPTGTGSHTVTIQQADSRFIPLPARSVSTVISSPPYCTRIDYAVATSPELFLLDLVSNASFRELRERLLGTTITHIDSLFDPPISWGPKCIETIASIRRHPSKASDTYYIKNFLQYFSGLRDSLEEIDRVTMPGGHIALVIQDSYYKEIHVDLAIIVKEMGEVSFWELQSRRDYSVSSTMAASNPAARNYRDQFGAVESVLIFKKPHSPSSRAKGKSPRF